MSDELIAAEWSSITFTSDTTLPLKMEEPEEMNE